MFYFSLNTNSAFLSNFEVMQILQQLKDNTQKKHKREASLATVTYEVPSKFLRFTVFLMRMYL